MLTKKTPLTPLSYLRECVEYSRLPQWVTLSETDAAMEHFMDSLRNEHDPERLTLLRQELIALIESKHLLVVTNAGRVLSDLAQVIL